LHSELFVSPSGKATVVRTHIPQRGIATCAPNAARLLNIAVIIREPHPITVRIEIKVGPIAIILSPIVPINLIVTIKIDPTRVRACRRVPVSRGRVNLLYARSTIADIDALKS